MVSICQASYLLSILSNMKFITFTHIQDSFYFSISHYPQLAPSVFALKLKISDLCQNCCPIFNCSSISFARPESMESLSTRCWFIIDKNFCLFHHSTSYCQSLFSPLDKTSSYLYIYLNQEFKIDFAFWVFSFYVFTWNTPSSISSITLSAQLIVWILKGKIWHVHLNLYD